jgi:hypothetical protein
VFLLFFFIFFTHFLYCLDAAPARTPAYRLAPASTINSREMDRLEDSMRNALSTIDNNEKRLNLIEGGGYRAISPGISPHFYLY